MVMGFKGGNHLVIVKTLTFETIYQIRIGSGPESNFQYFGRARMDLNDEDLNVLVIAKNERACLVTIAVKPPVSFFGNSGGKRHNLLFVC
jgi:hypothetical protein